MNIAIGSAQFGFDYGATNKRGLVAKQEALDIAQVAYSRGVRLLDTAFLYGESESVVGQIITQHQEFQVVTKTMEFTIIDPAYIGRELNCSFNASLARLGCQGVYGLLIHNIADLQAKPELWEHMQELRMSGKVQKIGVSINDTVDLETIFLYRDLDLVQLPLNVFDQRFLQHGFLQKIKDRGIEIHVRSIFLQGVLLSDFSRLPGYFQQFQGLMKTYMQELKSRRLSQLEAAVNFIKQQHYVDSIVAGFTHVDEATAFLDVFDGCSSNEIDFVRFAFNDEKLVKPVHWPAKETFRGML